MFGELGILREKANVWPVCAQILFGYDTLAKALDTLQVLGARALLARVSAESSSYRMHDLLRDYARRQLAEIPNVDSNDNDTQELIRNKHKDLLARCRQACAGGRCNRNSSAEGSSVLAGVDIGGTDILKKQ